MEISHNNRSNQYAADTGHANQVFQGTGRRTIWIASFAVFSAGLIVLSPGVLTALLLTATFSILNIVGSDKTTDGLFGTLSGSMLAASLLWLSILAGSAFAGYVGVATATAYVASLSSLAIYASLIVGESIMAAAILFALSRNHDAATKFAVLLDRKFAGLFGEVR